jgi:hypothetical protein
MSLVDTWSVMIPLRIVVEHGSNPEAMNSVEQLMLMADFYSHS